MFHEPSRTRWALGKRRAAIALALSVLFVAALLVMRPKLAQPQMSPTQAEQVATKALADNAKAFDHQSRRSSERASGHADEGYIGGQQKLRDELVRRYPKTLERIEEQIRVLEGEDMEESLDRLSDINFFLWPGPNREMPTMRKEYSPGTDRYLFDTIVSNRRVLKLLKDIKSLPPGEALALLDDHLSDALSRYEGLYEQEWRRIGNVSADPKLSNSPGAVIYRLGGTSPDDIQLAGARKEVLALVFLLGRLEDPGAAPTIRAVGERAISEYETLSTQDSQAARTHLAMGSIYSPLLIGDALLHSSEAGVSLFRDNVTRTHIQLRTHDALLTVYDHPVMLGAAPDFSQGSIEFDRYAVSSPEDFAALVRR